MKRLFLLLGILFLLSGCAATMDEETSNLKIRLLNLETLVKAQDKKLSELEERMDNLEKRVNTEFSNKLFETQTRFLSDIQELRRDLTNLQGKVEEWEFQRDEERKLREKTLEDFNTRLSSLELKLKELEEKLGKSSSNQTSNQTSRETQLPPSKQKTLPSETGEIPSKAENKSVNATEKASQEKVSQEKISQEKASQEKGSQEKPKEYELYQRAFSFYEKGDLKGARSLWEEYVRLYPKGKWVPQAYFYIGETYFKEKDYESAILSYQKVVDSQGPNPLKPRAMLRQADCFLALKDKKAATILLKKIIQLFPGTKEAEEAKKKLKALR